MSVYKIFILLVFNRECRNFCLANHACVSHLLRGQPHLLECCYRNCLIEHTCVHPVSEWLVFFTLQCELFASCNVSNNAILVSPRTGGVGVVNQMWTGLDRGRGGPKISKFVRTSFIDDPKACWVEYDFLNLRNTLLKYFSLNRRDWFWTTLSSIFMNKGKTLTGL